MKKVFDNGRFSVFVPSSRAEWIGVLLAMLGFMQAVAGDANMAFHLWEMAMLCEIADKVRK